MATDNGFALALKRANDPATSPEDLDALLDPRVLPGDMSPIFRAVAMNPNISTSRLRALAPHYPEAVLSNPVLPLLLLEDPALVEQFSWEALEALTRYPDQCPRPFLRRYATMRAWDFQSILYYFDAKARQRGKAEDCGESDWYEKYAGETDPRRLFVFPQGPDWRDFARTRAQHVLLNSYLVEHTAWPQEIAAVWQTGFFAGFKRTMSALKHLDAVVQALSNS